MAAQFTIIIVSYFNGEEIFDTIECAISQKEATKIIIVNNGNNNDINSKLFEIAKTNPKIEIINSNENLGFGRACNLGAANVKVGNLLFLNPDAILEKDALKNLVPDDLPKQVIIGGLIKNHDGSEQKGARRGELTISSAIISFLGIGKFIRAKSVFHDFNWHTMPMPNEIIEVKNISGAFFTIDANEFHKLGGFDEKYFLHVEDIDLCKRMRDNGGKILFNPKSSAHHIGGTSGANKSFVEWHKYKGFMRYFWKNYKGFDKIIVATFSIPLFVAIFSRLLLSKFRYG